MLRCEHKEPVKRWRLFLLCLVFLSACSLVLKYKECDKDKDCTGAGDNLYCSKEGYCVAKSGGSSVEDELITKECTRVYGVSTDNADTFNQDTILLGSILPTTGDMKAKGPKMEHAIELAVDEINEIGGILGKKVAVLFCDSATNTDTTKKALEHIISLKRIPAVIGPASSEVLIEAFSDVAKKAKLLMMSPAATSPQITGLSDDDLLWRTAPSDAIQGAAIANYLLKEATFNKVAIINRDDVYGNGLRDAIVDPLCETFPCKDADGHFFNSTYDKETPETDQSKIIVELKAFEPSITVVIGYFEDGGAFLELTKDTEMDRFILSDGLNTDQLKDLDLTNNHFCRMVGTQPASESVTNYQSFKIRFNKKYGEVGSYSANAYDAVYLIAYAIAATNTSKPTGPEVAKGLKRLSKGETVNVGTSDWDKTAQSLASSPNVTVNFEGASGPLDFDENGEAPSDIEGWAFDMDELKTFSRGTMYTRDGTYNDIFDSVSGQGEACKNITGKDCTTTLDCNDGDYCDKSRNPAVCMSPPSGQGTPCKSNADCEGFDADYCEQSVSYTCLKQGCSEELNDCSDDRICCDFEWIYLPSLCVDKVESRGLCSRSMGCESNDDCEEGTFCDLTTLATDDVAFCVKPPFGQGEPCEAQEDCLHYAATYCETLVSHTCLYQGCDKALNNCSEGYHCCQFDWLEPPLPNLCVSKELSYGHCACELDEHCREGEYCSNQSMPTQSTTSCYLPPTGQGDSCESTADCEGNEADYCDVDRSNTCLKQNCDETNDCSPGYQCCSLTDPPLCIADDRYETDCTAKKK